MGALTALQLDLIIATGERLLHPVGQSVLIRAVATAGVAGFLCWTVCALVTRAISRTAVKPYYALADHFERLADGDAGLAFDPREPEPGARRLVRAIAVFHHRAEASQRAEAALQLRYDRLHHNHAAERRLSAGLLIDPAAHRRYLGRVAPAVVEGSEPSVAAPALRSPA